MTTLFINHVDIHVDLFNISELLTNKQIRDKLQENRKDALWLLFEASRAYTTESILPISLVYIDL